MNASGPVDLLIKNAKFTLTMDDERRLLEGASIAISGDSVAAIGETAELEKLVGPDTKTIDAGEFFVTPGLVNSHVHLESCYDKGLLDDLPVVPWCERYFSYTYGTLTDESYYYAALASLLACLKTGTTTVADCGTIQTMEASCVRAVDDIGMRAVLARDLISWAASRRTRTNASSAPRSSSTTTTTLPTGGSAPGSTCSRSATARPSSARASRRWPTATASG
jgi:cytosine/adenosine deaminase-related metal-dependent hydrolase